MKAASNTATTRIRADLRYPRIIGALAILFFSFAALLAWRAGESVVSMLFLIFGALGLWLVLGSGHVAADEDVVAVGSLLGRHELAWGRVRKVETSGYGTLVLHADDARLVVPPPMMWSGPEKQALRALIVRQLRERSLAMRYSRTADYRIHKNVRVRGKAR